MAFLDRYLLTFALLFAATLSGSASAQLPQPKLDWLHPPGGQRGAQVQVALGGADLDDCTEILFSRPGLTARPARTPADEFFPDGQIVPNQFLVDIGADVPPGVYDAQALGRHGISTIRAFHVSDLPEIADNGANHALEQAQPLTVGAIVSGRTDPELEDFYSVELGAGDELTCEIWGARIDSQAEVGLEICRGDGTPLKAVRRWKRTDPVLYYTATDAGKYFVRVYDVTYRGGELFFYRLAVHSRASVDFVIPPAAEPNVEAPFDVVGRRLGGSTAPHLFGPGMQQRTVRAVVAPPNLTELSALTYEASAQPREIDVVQSVRPLTDLPPGAEGLHVGVAVGPVVKEIEPNDLPAQSQKLTLPGELAGQFYPERDVDWVEFSPSETGEVVFDMFSQRLGLATDPQLVLSRVGRNAQGEETLEQLAVADAGEARPATPGFDVASEDPYLRLQLEKGIVYRALVRDLDSLSRADPSHVYRLAIRRPRPSFRLLAAPVSPWATDAAIPQRWPLTVRLGGALAIPILVVRQDGFAGEIELSAENLPAGTTCQPVILGADKTQAVLVVTAAPDAPPAVAPLHIVGVGKTGDETQKTSVAPASLVWDSPAAGYHRARLNQRMTLAVVKETAPVSLRWETSHWETTPGSAVTAKLTVALHSELKEGLSVEPVGLPDGVSAKFSLAEDRKSAALELTVAEKVPVGSYHFVVRGKPKIAYQNNPEAAGRATEDQMRIAKLVEDAKAQRTQLATATSAEGGANADQVKQLDERIARGELALKEATERATRLAAAAQPADRLCDVVTDVGTLRILEKAQP